MRAPGASAHAIAPDKIVDQHARALQRRHDGKALRQEAGRGDGGFAEPEHRHVGKAARGIKPGVVEAGDDGRVVAAGAPLLQFAEKPRDCQRPVVVPLDRDRPHARGRRR